MPFLACAGDRVFLLPPAAGFAPAAGAAALLPLLAAGEVATLGAGTTVLPFGLYAGFAADFLVAAGFFAAATGAAEEDFLTLFVAALASPTDKKPKDKTAAERKSLLDKDSELIALAWTWNAAADLLDCFAAVGLAATLVAAKDADWVKENIFLRVRYVFVL